MSIFHANSLVGASGVAQYEIQRSVRFNSADSAYLSRTPSVAGNRKTWTWSGWVKRGALGSNSRVLFGTGTAVVNDGAAIRFNGSDQLEVYEYLSGSFYYNFVSTQVFRDPSSFGHLVVSVDTSQATSSNRVKIYWNGAQITIFGTSAYPSLDYQGNINTAVAHGIGRGGSYNVLYFDGYLADIHFIDGQALDPTSFGAFDANGVWQPKAYTGTYGTNGFHLPFSDNSTAAALGTDTSGNNNTWTTNNLSVAAGAGNDSLVDTPTNYGTDTGAGGEVRGNYCTLNPLKKGSSLTFANGNLDQSGSGQFQHSTSTFVLSTGKWYFEITHLVGEGNSVVGLVNAASLRANEEASYYLGQTANGYGFYANGQLVNNNALSGAWGTDWSATGSVIGCAFDADTGKIWFSYNGTWQASGNPATGSNPAFTASNHNSLCPAGRTYSSGQLAFNFGQRPFAYAAPTGFKALCTQNLPDPTIADGSTVMDVKLYTGNGSTQTISGLGFSPDLVWFKSRNNIYSHALVDILRGGDKVLYSDFTSAEVTMTGGISAWNNDGFTAVADTYHANSINTSSTTVVAWTWDAGSSTVTNTDGSITSQVRANPSAGFSVVTATCANGTNSYGHGLGVKPAMYIVKNRSASQNWQIWHQALSNETTAYLQFTTAAQQTYSTMWAASTSTTISLVGGGPVSSGADFVAYVFAPVAGYSAFGSYTGNGSNDGPFVYTGFRPRWILIKASSSVSFGSWVLHDTSRSSANVSDKNLYANSPSPEDGTYLIDCLSNGFKLRSSNFDATNGSGSTYIYAAFSENPFKTARAR